MFKRFILPLAVLAGLLGAGVATAQPANISFSVGVCDPKYPQRCIKPAADGSIPVTGASGSSGATAAASGTVAVVAGTGKPEAIDLFSSKPVLIKDTTGAYLAVATAALQTSGNAAQATAALQGAQGTGATYNPPTGGSGEIGYLSGIYAAAIDTAATSVKIDQTTPGTTNGVRADDSGAIASAVPARAAYVGANSAGNLTGLIQASASAAINVSTATTTQLVAISGSTKVYVTSFDVIAGGTGNATFVYGTGSSCGTGTTSLTGAYNLTAQAGISKGNGLGPVLVVPAGNALCITTSAAVQMSGSVAYTQF